MKYSGLMNDEVCIINVWETVIIEKIVVTDNVYPFPSQDIVNWK